MFSDRAPSPDVPDKDILKRPRTAPRPTSAAAKEQGVSDSAAAAEGAVTTARPVPLPGGVDKELEAKKKQTLDAEAAKQRAEEEQTRKSKGENCARAKQAKSGLESGIRLSRTNAAGQREVLDDSARAAELKHIQNVIDSECK